MAAKHTPGPWTAEPCECGWSQCRVIVSGCEKVAEGVRDHNARLIAAAPNLLEALNQCAEALAFARDKLGMCGEGDGADRRADAPDDIGSLPALIAARAAIAKAGA